MPGRDWGIRNEPKTQYKAQTQELTADQAQGTTYYPKFGICIERVMTDNGSCYRSKTFRAACNASPCAISPNHKPRSPMAKASAPSCCANRPTLCLSELGRSAELVDWLHRYN